jgi:hypothetical protein
LGNKEASKFSMAEKLMILFSVEMGLRPSPRLKNRPILGIFWGIANMRIYGIWKKYIFYSPKKLKYEVRVLLKPMITT